MGVRRAKAALFSGFQTPAEIRDGLLSGDATGNLGWVCDLWLMAAYRPEAVLHTYLNRGPGCGYTIHRRVGK